MCSFFRYVVLIASLFLAVCSAAVTSAADPPPIKILFLGDRGHHQPAARFRQIRGPLAERGIALTYTENVTDLNSKKLGEYAGLLVYANIDRIEPDQAKALLDYIAGGRGFIPLHCASYCFRNNDEIVALIGAQFERHGTGTFRVGPSDAGSKHPLLQGYRGFESWDETYVHTKHNEKDRIVLEYRGERRGTGKSGGEQGEPWTWVRTHGKGRVFYTAWGHDERTWGHPGFQNLLERGIRWAVGDDPGRVPSYVDRVEMTPLRKDVKPFEYVEGAKIPFYPSGRNWGAQGEPKTRMQKPLPAEESIKHLVTPVGFEPRLFLDETMVKDPPLGKPICMNWDERGRLWLCETVDYPNELQPAGKGRDRIRICEDTDGDGRADKFIVFADKLSIPTSLTFAYGGVVVHQAPHTLFLKDTTGDDRADVREILFTGWGTGDTHAGPSNLQYGLDNWYYGVVGYSGFDGTVAGEKHSFKQGFYRFKLASPVASAPGEKASGDKPASGGRQPPVSPTVTKLEFLRSTNNNTWGLGISEDGHIFASTANGNPSVHLTIPNRYYERVRGWSASVLGGIAGNAEMHPITEQVRQVDHHDHFTAAAGHAIYTARAYPQEYWNRTAFVCEPTGHLVATFVLQPSGSTFTSRNSWNLVASDDEWFAPIMAEVGPDGNVWVLDWYNYIVQHNPTPVGFKNGRGNAYETELRDKKHGRVYRIVHTARDKASGGRQPPVSPASGEKPAVSKPSDAKALGALTQPSSPMKQGADAPRSPTLADATPEQLVETLKNDNMLWRRHAQRLLIERADHGVVASLATLLKDKSVDAAGLNGAVVHALWALRGLRVTRSERLINEGLGLAWVHRSSEVRRNVAQSTPPGDDGADWLSALVHWNNPHVRLAELLARADIAATAPTGSVAVRSFESACLAATALQDELTLDDHWLTDAVTCAGAMDYLAFLDAALVESRTRWRDPRRSAPLYAAVVQRVAEHGARRGNADDVPALLKMLGSKANGGTDASGQRNDVAAAIISGLARGWPKDKRAKLTDHDESALVSALRRLEPDARGPLLTLASRWGSSALDKFTLEIADGFFKQVSDAKQTDEARTAAAAQLIDFRKSDAATANKLLALITPQASPQLAAGLLEAVGRSEAQEVGPAMSRLAPSLTPAARTIAVRVLLSRGDWTAALLDGVEQGKLQLADLSLDQKQSLASHATPAIAARAKKLLAAGGGLPSADRQKVIDELLPLTKRTGDAAAGKLVFVKNCAKCHTHGSVAASLRETVLAQGVAATMSIGPDLTGMAVHPKAELLTHVIDPSRSVEGNFRSYSVLTGDGRTLTGLLASESKTSIELYDTEGKKHVVLREDIERMEASAKSIMPEGFEKQVKTEEIAHLLEFLTQRGRFTPLPLDKVATITSARGMFFDPEGMVERMIFPDWKPKTFAGVPFQLVDPQDGRVKNTILLHGPNGTMAPKMPRSVSLPWNAPAKAIHLLSGVSGWGFPIGEKGSVSMIVRLHYAGEGGKQSQTEDHALRNGEHFADYIRRVDVPGSQFAFALRGQQLRYLAVTPKRPDKIERIELVKGKDSTAPIVMAVTIEARE